MWASFSLKVCLNLKHETWSKREATIDQFDLGNSIILTWWLFHEKSAWKTFIDILLNHSYEAITVPTFILQPRSLPTCDSISILLIVITASAALQKFFQRDQESRLCRHQHQFFPSMAFLLALLAGTELQLVILIIFWLSRKARSAAVFWEMVWSLSTRAWRRQS
jgi:hypothetical protein